MFQSLSFDLTKQSTQYTLSTQPDEVTLLPNKLATSFNKSAATTDYFHHQ